MKLPLLDVNFLIALLDPSHEAHEAAHRWFEQNSFRGWATCPIIENGSLRILTKLYASTNLRLPDIAKILQELCDSEHHHLLPDGVSILSAGRYNFSAITPKTITDVYLLDIARLDGGRLVTFDAHIPWQAVSGATRENLEILSAKQIHPH